MEAKNIYPVFEKMQTRAQKEMLNGQHSMLIWFTGLSGSGKSTLAIELERAFYQRGLICTLLDGDNVRTGINNNLGFSEADRVENLRRIAEVAKLFVNAGIITLAAFISPTEKLRQMVADIVGEENFLQIYVNTPLEECERRDVKGLYARARRGEVKDFTGISAPFEAPERPLLTIDTSKVSLKDAVSQLLEAVSPYIVRQPQNDHSCNNNQL